MNDGKLCRATAGCVALAIGLLPALVDAAPIAQADGEPGLLGPLVVLIVIVLLNIAVLALAFRLRRVFRQIGDEGEDEQPAPHE